MKKVGKLLFALCLCCYLLSCGKEEENVTPTPTSGITPNANGKITFTSLSPLFSTSCAGSSCHTSAISPLFIGNYSTAKANGAKIVSEVVSKKMPKGGSLTAAQIAALKQWETDGFLEK